LATLKTGEDVMKHFAMEGENGSLKTVYLKKEVSTGKFYDPYNLKVVNKSEV
jgi:hypothetical protein